MKDLRCMSYTSRGTSEILVAGMQDQMFTIDVDKGTVTKQVQILCHEGVHFLTELADTYQGTLHDNEKKQTYLRCNQEWRRQYLGLYYLQRYQNLECPLFVDQ